MTSTFQALSCSILLAAAPTANDGSSIPDDPARAGSQATPSAQEEQERRLHELEEAHRREIRRLEEEIRQIRDERLGERAEGSLEEDVERFLQRSEPPDAAAEPRTFVQRLNELNPRITVFGDFVARLDDRRVGEDLFPEEGAAVEEGENLGDRFSLRETELDLRADVDPFAKGVLIATLAEEEPGEFVAEVEEGYVLFTALPKNLQAKVGRFRSAFGRNNLLHTHDLPQTSRPLPIRGFLGPEGDVVNGASLSYLVPNPFDAPLEITAQVFNGENEAILAGGESRHPAILGHVRWFQDLTENQFFEVGASDLIGYADARKDDVSNLAGIDLLYKWRPRALGEYRSLVADAEAFWLHRQRPEQDSIDALGAFAYVQYQPSKNWYFGVRADFAESPVSEFDRAWGASAYVSWYTTEFLRFRLTYEHLERNFDDELDTLMLQVTWVFGSHPAEPYWVNR
jgi:hypothetical protein